MKLNKTGDKKDEDDPDAECMGGRFSTLDEIKEARPWFLKEDNIMDLNGKRPCEPGYDETTLSIPQTYWE